MTEATADRREQPCSLSCRALEKSKMGSLPLGFRPFCARMPIQNIVIQNCRHMRLVATERISSTAALATKCASIAKNMTATSVHTRQIAPDRNAEHAAGQTTETLGASNAVGTYSCTKFMQACQ